MPLSHTSIIRDVAAAAARNQHAALVGVANARWRRSSTARETTASGRSSSSSFERRTFSRRPLSCAGTENVLRSRSSTAFTGTISRFTSTWPASSCEMSSRLSNSCSSDSVHCRIWSISLRLGSSVGAVAQRCREQSERMQRLAQVVIGGREKARLGAVRFLGARACLFGQRVLVLQLIDELLVLAAQADLRATARAWRSTNSST